MPGHELLILAVTRMLAGVCTAGVVAEPAPRATGRAGVHWVRPVKDHDTLLLGDITDADGRILQPWDVVDLPWLRPRPQPPHAEDWLVDWVRQRPRLLRRLEGADRARFLARYADPCPAEVLGPTPSRSLCLVHPADVWGRWRAEGSRLEARLGFLLEGDAPSTASAPEGAPVTDLRWRALGRAWLGEVGGELTLHREALLARLGAQDLYLALGLGRLHRGQHPLLVIGVHTVPDYPVTVDYSHL